MENKLIHFQKSDDLLGDIQGIIEDARYQAYQAVNLSLVQRNWLLGYRISQEELKGEGRAEYGLEVIKGLSKDLTAIYGKGFTKSEWKICADAFMDAL